MRAMMRVPELKRLMRALGVSGDGCVEKADLIRQLGDAPGVELTPDRKDLFYKEGELRSLEMHHLRSLMERHRVKLPAGDMDEAEERAAAMDSFAAGGWFGPHRQPPSPSPATDAAMAIASSGFRSDAPVQPASSRALGEIKGGKRLMGADSSREDPGNTSSSSSKRRSSTEIGKQGSSASASSSELPSTLSPTGPGEAAAPSTPATSSFRRPPRTVSRQASTPSSTVSSARVRKRPTQRSTSSGAVTGAAAQMRPSSQVISQVALRPLVVPPSRSDTRGSSRPTQDNSSTDIGAVNEREEQHHAR